jgi:hypothetical protein
MSKFKNTRYITKGIVSKIPLYLQLIMWDLIDKMEVSEKDYLQVFKLSKEDDKQKIIHTQEVPEYTKEYLFSKVPDSDLITTKIFIIDDVSHSTMLLASEY